VATLAAGGMVVPTAMATGPTDTCMPTIRIIATTGIGITKNKSLGIWMRGTV